MYAPLPNVGPINWIDAMEHLDKNPLLFTLAVLILADVITGISKSLVTSTTDSSIGKKGFASHITIILLVWLLYPWSIYQVIPLSSANGVQVVYETSSIILGMCSWNSGSGKASFSSWVQFADDSKVVHTTDISNWQKQVNEAASKYLKTWVGTQEEYNALGTYDNHTLYLIPDSTT